MIWEKVRGAATASKALVTESKVYLLPLQHISDYYARYITKPAPQLFRCSSFITRGTLCFATYVAGTCAGAAIC